MLLYYSSGLQTTCRHMRQAQAPSVCVCLCTHVNDHLSRLEEIMRPGLQGSLPAHIHVSASSPQTDQNLQDGFCFTSPSWFWWEKPPVES